MSNVTAYSVADQTGLLSRGEVDLMKKYAKKSLSEESIAVIIGAGAGTSSLAVLEECPKTTLFSIDKIFPTGGRYTPGEKQNLIDAGLWEKCSVIQIVGDSVDIGRSWPQKLMVDFMFIDGDHRYNAVKADLLQWLPRIKESTPILTHDYADKETKPRAGVKQACDEILLSSGYSLVEINRYLAVWMYEGENQ